MQDQRRHYAIPMTEAMQEAPILGSLMQRLRASQACGQCIQPLIPPMLRPHIRFGAIENGEWCVIVHNNATGTKVRNLVPMWLAHLKKHEHPVTAIRLHMAGSQRLL